MPKHPKLPNAMPRHRAPPRSPNTGHDGRLIDPMAVAGCLEIKGDADALLSIEQRQRRISRRALAAATLARR